MNITTNEITNQYALKLSSSMAIRFNLIAITLITIGEAMNCGTKLANKKSVVNRNAKHSFDGMNCGIMSRESGFPGHNESSFLGLFSHWVKGHWEERH